MIDIKLVEQDGGIQTLAHELICPFRTKTLSFQGQHGEVVQLVEYPECQYDKCPFYKKFNCDRINK